MNALLFARGDTWDLLDDECEEARNSLLVDTCYMFGQYFAPKGSDKICMMMTRLAWNRAIESSYWRMDNDSDVGL
jgi:hypothetical protein